MGRSRGIERIRGFALKSPISCLISKLPVKTAGEQGEGVRAFVLKYSIGSLNTVQII
jgi:hypothetical protein